MTARRNPGRLYLDLVRDCGQVLGLEPEAARLQLYALLKEPFLSGHPELEGVLERYDVSPTYVRNQLLSLGAWPVPVLEAVLDGLPLKTARQVARLREPTLIAKALTTFREARDEGSADAARQVERLVHRLTLTQRRPMSDTQQGWLPPVTAPADPVAPPGPVWIYPMLRSAELEFEALHPDLIEAVVALYAPAGSRIVDLTAGLGTVARAATSFGCWVWSGDIAPRETFIHAVDATHLRPDDGPGHACADVIVLHPPTFYAWLATRPEDEVEGVEGYTGLIAHMVAGALPILRPGGRFVLVSRPVRTQDRVYTAIGELGRELEDAGLMLIAYHLAVDSGGREDWHVLVGRAGHAG